MYPETPPNMGPTAEYIGIDNDGCHVYRDTAGIQVVTTAHYMRLAPKSGAGGALKMQPIAGMNENYLVADGWDNASIASPEVEPQLDLNAPATI